MDFVLLQVLCMPAILQGIFSWHSNPFGRNVNQSWRETLPAGGMQISYTFQSLSTFQWAQNDGVYTELPPRVLLMKACKHGTADVLEYCFHNQIVLAEDVEEIVYDAIGRSGCPEKLHVLIAQPGVAWGHTELQAVVRGAASAGKVAALRHAWGLGQGIIAALEPAQIQHLYHYTADRYVHYALDVKVEDIQQMRDLMAPDQDVDWRLLTNRAIECNRPPELVGLLHAMQA